MICAAVAATPFEGARATGRVTRAVPSLLGTTAGTHFHLGGNGEMVKEFKEGCLAAGVPEERVTTEIYFNGKAEPDPDVVEYVATSLRELAAPAEATREDDEGSFAVVSMG